MPAVRRLVTVAVCGFSAATFLAALRDADVRLLLDHGVVVNHLRP